MPLGLDQKVGAVVWSPLGWGRLTGKIRRGQPRPDESRLQGQGRLGIGPPVADEYLYTVVDALDEVAAETGKTVPQIALNWLLQRPTVATRHHRRAQRGAAAAEPRRGRLESDAGAGRQARRRERGHADVSLLAPARLRRAESVSDGLATAERFYEVLKVLVREGAAGSAGPPMPHGRHPLSSATPNAPPNAQRPTPKLTPERPAP